MKSLEDLIKQNREAFDSDLPSENVWKSIHVKLQKQNAVFSWKPYVAAASIMFFISFTWLIANHKLNSNVEHTAVNLPVEVSEAQVQFSSLIEIKRNELNQYRSTNPELVSDFEGQLIELQKNYTALLPQLKDENKKEIVLQAVIENLQMQVEVLNQQIDIISQLKQNRNNETDKIVPL